MKRNALFLLIILPLLFLISLFGAPVQAMLETAAPQNLPSSPSVAEKIAAELQEVLEVLPDGQMLTVIVTMAGQADLSQIPGASRPARLQGVIRALQAKADASQRQIINRLSFKRSQGLVDQVTPLWVFNGLSVTATSAVIEELAARADVARITPDAIDIVPAAPEPNLSVINAPALWSLDYQGQGIVVANMDSGVDLYHPDLSGRWRGGGNSWFDPYGQHPTTPIDLSGHGTWTMGIMVGGSAGGTAIGVAPQAQWIAVKIFNDAGGSTASAIHQGFQWLLDPDGDPETPDAPHVVTNSWSLLNPGCDLTFEADMQSLRAAGILPVFAAGNYGPGSDSSRSPANNPSAFAVGATYDNDAIYGLSSRGPGCGGSIFPDLVAPGIGIHTTDLYGFYADATGTSMAAPHVSGGLALLLSAFPGATAADQEAALRNSAFDLGSAGPDNDYGYGRLDLQAAYQLLQQDPPPTSTPPPPTPTPPPPTPTPPPPTPTPPQPTPTPSPPPGDINLALNRPVAVSSIEDSAHAGGYAVDGGLVTWWQTARAKGKNKLPAEWLTVDLGGNVTVGQVVLTWADNFATSYTIQVSTDNDNWNTVYQTNAGNGGTDTISFTPLTARYLKLNSTAWSSGSLRNWLRELEVYQGSGDPPPPTPTPTPPPTGGVHVGDLDGTAVSGSRSRWDATVSILVHDDDDLPLSGATVSGSWSGGVSGNSSCVTGATGVCSLTRTRIKSNMSSVRFTVNDVSFATLSYQPAANHDPDSDSDGFSIQIGQP
jgi:subtilisin family serine protease